MTNSDAFETASQSDSHNTRITLSRMATLQSNKSDLQCLPCTGYSLNSLKNSQTRSLHVLCNSKIR